MGKHAGPEGYDPNRITEPPTTIDLTDDRPSAFDAAMGEVQKEAGFLRIEDAVGTLTNERKRNRIAAMMVILSRAAALGLIALAVVVGGGVVAPTPASAAAEYPLPPIVQHSTKFGHGTWNDLHDGCNVYFAAPLFEYLPGVGWIESPWARVQVQERTRRGWRVRATFRTGTDGIAHGYLCLPVGKHYLKAVHLPDEWTLGTSGMTRVVRVTVPDEATDGI